jgi:hypothetical protein
MYRFVLEWMKIHEWKFHKTCIENSYIPLGCDICVVNFWVEWNNAFTTKPTHLKSLAPQKPSYRYQNPQKIFDNNIIIIQFVMQNLILFVSCLLIFLS